MIAFTICSRDLLAYARALHETFSRHHPESEFYIALPDDGDGLDAAAFPFTILRLPELGLPDAEGMAARYDITEFRAAIKPFAFQVLFDRHPGSSVVFLDPGVFVTSRFDELEELISDGAECVLTPTITEPAEHAALDEQQLLRYGAYDLGFCCLADSPSVRRIVWWWARRLETLCIDDLDAGLFIDQRWADLFPAFIERTRILRHPGYNVGYWNLPQRRMRRTDSGWSVNGMPLRFFSFRGVDAPDGGVGSRHVLVSGHRMVTPPAELLAELRRTVMRHRQDGTKDTLQHS